MAEIEQLNAEIRALVRERQDLRTRGAEPDELEHNRRRIVSCQWTLARKFGEVYAPRSPKPAA